MKKYKSKKTCSIHPTYKAIYAPKANCKVCRKMYKERCLLCIDKQKSYTLNQLNKLADSNNHIVLIQCGQSILTLDYFTQLELGEDYFDAEEQKEGYSGCNAYVVENPHRFPIEDIDSVFVASKVKVK